MYHPKIVLEPGRSQSKIKTIEKLLKINQSNLVRREQNPICNNYEKM